MKFRSASGRIGSGSSHPARGAWIEMKISASEVVQMQSHPARGAWIEMAVRERTRAYLQSHPARGAWIEMQNLIFGPLMPFVAPRKGCVD